MKRLPLPSPLSRGAIVAAFALLSACAGQQDEPRGAIGGKADLVGSCAQSNCDDQAPDGDCFCDADCVEFGDCCDDFTDNCIAETCGGVQGIECDDGSACIFERDQACGADGALGACEPIGPFPCTANVDPVCGCNGTMFLNECEATTRGISATDDASVCQPGGGDHDPCGESSCGDLCRLCAPGDAGCVETAVVKTCNVDGQCTPSAPRCDEASDHQPCGEDSCGEPCTLCAPGDPDCFETQVLKFCDADDTCRPSFPICN